MNVCTYVYMQLKVKQKMFEVFSHKKIRRNNQKVTNVLNNMYFDLRIY